MQNSPADSRQAPSANVWLSVGHDADWIMCIWLQGRPWPNHVDRVCSLPGRRYCNCHGTNMVPCCSACNLIKGGVSAGQFVNQCGDVAAYEPDEDLSVRACARACHQLPVLQCFVVLKAMPHLTRLGIERPDDSCTDSMS